MPNLAPRWDTSGNAMSAEVVALARIQEQRISDHLTECSHRYTETVRAMDRVNERIDRLQTLIMGAIGTGLLTLIGLAAQIVIPGLKH